MRTVLVSFFAAFCFFSGGAQEAPEGLFIESKAPDFTAKDQYGAEIRLKDLLKKGKVILVFYRGEWCPYCNKELAKLQDSLQLIKHKGATVIAVSPELPDNITKTIAKTNVEYSILYDKELKIMKSYEVDFEVPENTLLRYKNAGLDIEKQNGPNVKYLPVPAVFIIDKEARVIYRFFELDYKKRPNVSDLLKYL
jgi:peroxiredoxin